MILRLQVTQPSDLSYRIIALTKGQVTLVDAADYEWLNQWKWCAQWMPGSRSFYAVRSGPRDENRKQSRITMSRAIMNAPPGVLVDHEDHATLNNRRYNLRLSTHSQNGCNRRKHIAKSSRIKGVSWHASEKRWRAAIKIEGRPINIGQFKSQEEAAEAYRTASLKYHGEFSFCAGNEEYIS